MINWPENKKFAFTIVDDTDCTTLENGPLIYDFLKNCGLKTTKSIWIFDGEKRFDNSNIIGSSCQNELYLEWVKKLNAEGFEIALHSSSWSSSNREIVKEALILFENYFGKNPDILVQHCDNKDCESIYWGENRVSGFVRLIYKLLMIIKGQKRNIYLGDNEKTEYFWGDICREKIKYVRNFVYPGINTLKTCPYMPYHDPDRPYVNNWFASTEAPEVNTFNDCLSEENQNKLEKEGGACIIYTHFGKNFVHDGKLNTKFMNLIKILSKKDGWFVPANQILDYLMQNKRKLDMNISHYERRRLEIKWLINKLKIGTS